MAITKPKIPKFYKIKTFKIKRNSFKMPKLPKFRVGTIKLK